MAEGLASSAPAHPHAHTYMVEHLDPELGPWSALEYKTIATESTEAQVNFVLSSVQSTVELPVELRAVPGLVVEHRSVEQILKDKERVCLLDPAAKDELSPQDGNAFDVFLFGGILGDDPPRGKHVLIAQETQTKSGAQDLADRTSELRIKGYRGRRLGPVQMTTDTAVRVTRMVVEEKGMQNTVYSNRQQLLNVSTVPLEDIKYLDHPELKINDHESTEMPFRYVKDQNGTPVMPKGMIDLIKKDSEKGFGDLL